MRVAVLGLGRMGRAIAGRLQQQGHELVVWNRSSGRAGDLAAAGATEAAAPADAAATAAVVITMLADDDAVRAVVLGEGGVVQGLGPDAVLVDCSTVSPAVGEELQATVGHFVAMPVLGNPDAVAAGRAVLLAGGAPEDVTAIEPLLESLGGNVRRYDRPGLSAAAKLTSNLILLSGLVTLAEAFGVARAGGLDEDQLCDLLQESPLVAPALRNRFDALRTGRTDPWWTSTLGAKDVGLAIGVAEQGGTSLPVAAAVESMYRATMTAGWADDDIAAVARLYGR